MNILFLATDAYGGHGGIAHYNRCLAEALAEMPEVARITLLPRIVREPVAKVPEKISFVTQAAGSKLRYIKTLAGMLGQKSDLLICGHINLLPLAAVYSWVKRTPLVLQVHGIDAWQMPPSRFQRACVKTVTAVWSVSAVTRDRMNAWARLPFDKYTVIPNTIHPERYGMAPRRHDLVARYGLQGKKVILTLARLDPRERYKGIDEILEILPTLRQKEPALCYLIAGTGADKDRLAAKAHELGVGEAVVFTGYVAEEEKADIFRLADVFAMPGRGEGFGIVYLEAMACGVQVLGSVLDGSRDALKEGELGQLVDPDNPASLVEGLSKAINAPRQIPQALQYFSWPMFVQRVSNAATRCICQFNNN